MLDILIFEDHSLMRESLSQLIDSSPDLQLKGAYPDCNSAVEWVGKHRPHIVLMDIDMPGINGIEGTRQIKEAFPQTDVLILTVFDDGDRVFEAMCAGANGYILKKTPAMKILDAIREVGAGGAPMSPAIARKVVEFFRRGAVSHKSRKDPEISLTVREREILAWLVKGHSYKMIATECAVSINTIRSHLKKIYKKMHVHSMTEAVAKAIRDGLV